ncbi:MAG: MotA/TolQ/ExbB proton channel family protein [Elusimicrobia bacterium]|nr:MotA/TolQ/ExbB proton channel family protein [Elusimicrobiota bacterium]
MAAPGPGFGVGVKDIIVSGGPTLALLAGLSVYSVALIWERWKTYQRSAGDLARLVDKLRAMIQQGSLADAVGLCKGHKGLASGVVMASLTGSPDREDRKRSTQRAIERALAELQKGLTALGTIASVAPFIGLFGTVVGVMRAFRDLASAAGAGPGVVAIGISEALVCTAAGIFVAIPALAAYNYFNHRSARFAEELGWIAEEIIEKLSEKSAR